MSREEIFLEKLKMSSFWNGEFQVRTPLQAVVNLESMKRKGWSNDLMGTRAKETFELELFFPYDEVDKTH